LLQHLNPQRGGQIRQNQQQQRLQNTAQIQQARSTNIGLRAQREFQIAQLKQRAADREEDRRRFEATQARFASIDDTLNRLREAQIRKLDEPDDPFTKSQLGASTRALGGTMDFLRVLGGGERSPSGLRKSLADEMMIKWREGGIEAAMDWWDQAFMTGEQRIATDGLLPPHADEATELHANNMMKQMERFNKLLTAETAESSRKQAARDRRERERITKANRPASRARRFTLPTLP
jgi:hypothetical protein